jgi:catechol 2,3-dioxygenase-like lactoylglutathione lyase family enzyme
MKQTRREMLQGLAAFGAGAAAVARTASAQSSALPLKTTGLEHIGMTVPDPKASAEFYGRIFDPQLFKERDIANRFYVRTGIAYLAFGAKDTAKMPVIDHFCALVEGYRAADVRKELEAAGIQMGTGPLGMPTDSDGMRLQLLGVPGGLAGTIIPGGRISQEEPAVEAIGIDHIMLAVSDLDKASSFYGRFFGKATKAGKRVWFDVAHTKLGLEKVAVGEQPRVHHFALRVAGFDKARTTERLTKLGVKMAPSNDEGLLRFQDLNGFLVELKAA